MRWTTETNSWATRQRQQFLRGSALQALLSAFRSLNYTVTGVEESPKQIKFVVADAGAGPDNLLRVLKLSPAKSGWHRRVLKPMVHELHLEYLRNTKSEQRRFLVLTITF